MNRKFIAVIIVLMVIATVTVAIVSQGSERPVWQDEFDQALLDTSRWTLVQGNGCPENCGFGNNELQVYTGNPENVFIQDGKLVIRADKAGEGKTGFTSAKLISAGKGDWTSGRIEVRAKLPAGRGTWPAIWMLPTLERPMKWPADGEIDIMEHVGYNQGWIYGTIHTEKYNHMIGTQKSDSILVADADREFHTYTLEWSRDKLTWYVDEAQYNQIERGTDGREGWPFDQQFHLILNLAVGGNWGGKYGVDDSIWPQEMVVDYVRVYRL